MMRSRWVKLTALPILAMFLLTACATFGPPGPSAPAYIGEGKTQTQYDGDDARCRQLATARSGDPAEVQKSQAASAIVGTLIGAAAGAAIGGAIGGGSSAGIGAAVGGTAGMATGLGSGTAQAQGDAARIQQRWNSEYYACMYAAGHQVPGVAAPRAAPATPQPAYMPPPPPPPPYGGPQPGAMPPPPPPTGYQQPATPPGPPPAATAPAPPQAGAAPCKPTGKYVKTTQGLVPECE